MYRYKKKNSRMVIYPAKQTISLSLSELCVWSDKQAPIRRVWWSITTSVQVKNLLQETPHHWWSIEQSLNKAFQIHCVEWKSKRPAPDFSYTCANPEYLSGSERSLQFPQQVYPDKLIQVQKTLPAQNLLFPKAELLQCRQKQHG